MYDNCATDIYRLLTLSAEYNRAQMQKLDTILQLSSASEN